MSGQVLIAVDKGTSETKVQAYDLAGKLITQCSEANAIDATEEDLQDVWIITQRLLRQTCEVLRDQNYTPIGLGISAHMGGLILLDGDANPIAPAMLWTDQRSKDVITNWERNELTNSLYAKTGTALLAGLTLPLWAWLRANRPHWVEQTKHVVFMKDWIRYRLTGVLATDESEHMWIPGDTYQRCFTSEIERLMGVDGLLERLPPTLAAVDVVGYVTEEVSKSTLLPQGLPVVTGVGDAVAAAIGMGCLTPGSAYSVLGTSFLNNIVTEIPVLEPWGIGFNFLTLNGHWLRLLANTGGGSINLRWLQEQVNQPYATIDTWVEETPAGSNGVLYLPYLSTSGVTAPFYNLTARGAFIGLQTDTTLKELARAVYEGIALAMKDCYETSPVVVDRIRLGGGGSRNATLCQIMADCTNRTIEVTEVSEATGLGTALLVGVGVGAYADLQSGVNAAVKVSRRYEPRPHVAEFYRDWYGAFRTARSSMTDAWQHIYEIRNQDRMMSKGGK